MRSRNIKPAFFKDSKVVACSFEARLLFQGLWCMADYMGRLKYDALEIKMEVFPADSVDIDAKMQELSENKLIEIYTEHSGTTLVQVSNFTRHQNPHINEKQDKDKNPMPCLPSVEECKQPEKEDEPEKPDIEQQVKDALVLVREYYQSDPADSLLLIPDSCSLIPEPRFLKPDSPLLHPEDLSANADPPAKPKEPKTNPTWKAYALAYESRYGAEPIRNASVNGQLSKFIDRVGREEAPNIAAYYVSSNNQWYVQTGHAVSYLLKDAEKLRTEWVTNTQMTGHGAREVDRQAKNAGEWQRLIDEAENDRPN